MSTKRAPYDRQYYENGLARLARNSRRYRNRFELIREVIKPGRFLEIGCGTGELLSLVAASYQVEGIDLSSHAVSELRAQQGFSVRHEDINESLLEDGCYEGIAAFNVLEHLSEPGAVLRKIVNALKPGGVLVGSVPYNGAFLGRIHTLLTNLMDRTHVSTYPPNQWYDLFTGSGFHRIELFGETNIAFNAGWYLRGPQWRWQALNLMFVCWK